MPRTSRIVVSGYPHHIIQRGHNRQAVFLADGDYRHYLKNLREWKDAYGCRIYAYCLMTNHVHLIIDPGEDERNLAYLMKRVSGRHTRYVNRLEGRTGSLWEGRFKSSLISADEYLLACCRYVELNPVRAGIVADPADYRWSSYGVKIGNRQEEWLDDDPCYLGLADSEKERAEIYAAWVKGTIAAEEWELIRTSLQRGQLTGSPRFVEEMEKKLERRLEPRGPGRPRKVGK
ncbi:MAG: transposase [Coprothermobacterota bacterium]|nr:transposase [Coprothermobacterota bacterium]